jgi:adenylate kinase family enzyme
MKNFLAGANGTCLTKIVLVGISGTGKTTLSQELAFRTGLPLYPMDSLIWRENWEESLEPEIQQSLERIAETDCWIVEGWIDHYSQLLLEQSELVVYLDFPGWCAVLGGLQRWWRYRGKRRPELPDGCNESLDLSFLTTMWLRSERPHIESILASYPPERLVRVRSRSEAKLFLSSSK